MFSNGKDITIPAKALNELAKSLSGDAETLRIGISDLAIRFQVGPTTIVTSLIAADYPQIDKLSHPAGETVLAYVNRDEFIDVIETVALIAESKGAGVPRRVSLHITAGQITVTAADQSVGAGDATIDADYDGPDTRIDFSVQYLIDGFRQMNGERAIIEFHPGDSIKPVHLRGDADIDDTYRYVVMPLRT
jgi:DNA polymerase-3 subunit beta